MKKILLLLIFFTLTILTSCNDKGNANIKIGVILPLTGSFGEEGQKGLAAIKLAEKEINNSVDFPVKIELSIEDGTFTGKNSIAAYNKLLLKGVSVFVSFGTPPTQAIKNRVNDSNIPLLAVDGTSGLAKSSKWIFEFLPPVEEVGQAVGEFYKDNWPLKKMALFTMNDSSGDDFANGLFSIVGSNIPCEYFDANATDVRSQILKLINTKPGVIVVRGYSTGYITAMNQLLESGYEGEIITDANITSVLNKLRNGDRNIYFVSQSFGGYANNIESQKFISNVNADSNIEPTLYSAYLYEMIKAIAKAGNINGTTPNDIRENLLKIKEYKTMFGTMTLSEDGDVHLPFIVLKIGVNGIDIVNTDIK